MTQHPFDREYSEQEAKKLNSESTSPKNEEELKEEEAEDVAGGCLPCPTLGVGEDGFPKDKVTTLAIGEEGGSDI